MDLDRDEAERQLKKYPGFGLCELDIAEMKRQTGDKVRVVLTATGKSHVDVLGCDDDVEVQEILAGPP